MIRGGDRAARREQEKQRVAGQVRAVVPPRDAEAFGEVAGARQVRLPAIERLGRAHEHRLRDAVLAGHDVQHVVDAVAQVHVRVARRRRTSLPSARVRPLAAWHARSWQPTYASVSTIRPRRSSPFDAVDEDRADQVVRELLRLARVKRARQLLRLRGTTVSNGGRHERECTGSRPSAEHAGESPPYQRLHPQLAPRTWFTFVHSGGSSNRKARQRRSSRRPASPPRRPRPSASPAARRAPSRRPTGTAGSSG